MRRVINITVFLDGVKYKGDDETTLKETVKSALRDALDADDNGESDIDFSVDETEEDL